MTANIPLLPSQMFSFIPRPLETGYQTSWYKVDLLHVFIHPQLPVQTGLNQLVRGRSTCFSFPFFVTANIPSLPIDMFSTITRTIETRWTSLLSTNCRPALHSFPCQQTSLIPSSCQTYLHLICLRWQKLVQTSLYQSDLPVLDIKVFISSLA